MKKWPDHSRDQPAQLLGSDAASDIYPCLRSSCLMLESSARVRVDADIDDGGGVSDRGRQRMIEMLRVTSAWCVRNTQCLHAEQQLRPTRHPGFMEHSVLEHPPATAARLPHGPLTLHGLHRHLLRGPVLLFQISFHHRPELSWEAKQCPCGHRAIFCAAGMPQ